MIEKRIEPKTKSILGNIGVYSETREIGRAPVGMTKSVGCVLRKK
jgi:hypothetical protein